MLQRCACYPIAPATSNWSKCLMTIWWVIAPVLQLAHWLSIKALQIDVVIALSDSPQGSPSRQSLTTNHS